MKNTEIKISKYNLTNSQDKSINYLWINVLGLDFRTEIEYNDEMKLKHSTYSIFYINHQSKMLPLIRSINKEIFLGIGTITENPEIIPTHVSTNPKIWIKYNNTWLLTDYNDAKKAYNDLSESNSDEELLFIINSHLNSDGFMKV